MGRVRGEVDEIWTISQFFHEAKADRKTSVDVTLGHGDSEMAFGWRQDDVIESLSLLCHY